jgi:hypothetical protein
MGRAALETARAAALPREIALDVARRAAAIVARAAARARAVRSPAGGRNLWSIGLPRRRSKV